ncbi:hypothetical protein B0H11DRAFT_1911743 [Mycena galericulata]|nr:hypothetical protein B0H11DRAFT_1911743 [Mycena galericulata]
MCWLGLARKPWLWPGFIWLWLEGSQARGLAWPWLEPWLEPQIVKLTMARLTLVIDLFLRSPITLAGGCDDVTPPYVSEAQIPRKFDSKAMKSGGAHRGSACVSTAKENGSSGTYIATFGQHPFELAHPKRVVPIGTDSVDIAVKWRDIQRSKSMSVGNSMAHIATPAKPWLHGLACLRETMAWLAWLLALSQSQHITTGQDQDHHIRYLNLSRIFQAGHHCLSPLFQRE